MAITIQQAPSSPNMANNNLVYAVTSNTSSAAQYQFVCDILYSGSNTVLQRIKQQPNLNGVGVFDIGQIVTNYIESDNNWTTFEYDTNTNVAKRFSIKFGEQYGSSPSSSITLYTGVGAVSGSPAVTASDYFYVIDGLVDPNDKVDWNWDSSSYYSPRTVNTSNTFSFQNALTYAPFTQNIQLTEYATLSFINGNFDGSTTVAQDIFGAKFNFYDATGSLISTFTNVNNTQNGGGPRTGTVSWSTASVSQTQGTQLITVGVGPQNLAGYRASDPPVGTAYYDVIFHPQLTGGTTTINESGSYGSYRYIIQGPVCGYDGVRFAWKNEFGVWDYYTFTLQNDKAYNVERQNYEQSFVPFNSNTPVPYSKERRGTTNFYNKLTQIETANSNWLTQNEADWLKELFFSANVFQQVGSEFYPVIITSANVVEKTNPRTQKVFQYQIEFQPANQKNPRI
jgi:hypothetical protein